MRLLGWLLAVPAGFVAIAFAVANRGTITLSFDPLPYVLELPLYAALLGALLLGVLVGGLVAWLSGFRTGRGRAGAG